MNMENGGGKTWSLSRVDYSAFHVGSLPSIHGRAFAANRYQSVTLVSNSVNGAAPTLRFILIDASDVVQPHVQHRANQRARTRCHISHTNIAPVFAAFRDASFAMGSLRTATAYGE